MDHQTQIGNQAELIAFFEQYAAATQAGNADAIADAYFETYIESSPGAATARKTDDSYRKAVAEKSAMMKQLGLTKLDVAIQASREFAPSHYLVEAQWRLQFNAPGKKPASIRFLISYVLRMEPQGPKILAYVSHEDEAAVMRREGVL